MQRNMWPRLAVVLCCLAVLSCTPEDEGEEGETETSGETGESEDDVCDLESPFICECMLENGEWKSGGIVYGEPETAYLACWLECDERYGEFVDDSQITPVDCSVPPPQTDCSDWPPGRAIAFDEVSGAYFVERTLVKELMLDPAPLYACEATALIPLESGGARVVGARSGELAHELGLQDYDVVLSINQYPVNSASDLLSVFDKLWSEGVLSFELEVRRGGRPLTLHYRLVKP